MKKLLTILFLVCLANKSFSQITYFNYLDETCEWRQYGGGWDGVNGHTYYSTIYFDGFETFNSIPYYKKYINQKHIQSWWNGSVTTDYALGGPYYIREDSTGKFYEYDAINDTEAVYFDNQIIANAIVGDPFPNPGTTCNVETIGTTYLGTRPLKWVKGSVSSFPASGTVEGIGFIGLACTYVIEGSGFLACYTKNGNNIQFDSSIDCSLFPNALRNGLSTNNFELQQTNLYPNPTNSLSFFDNTINQYTTAIIYNPLGQEIAAQKLNTTNQESINLTNFPIGIYLIKLSNTNTSITKTIIKK